MMELVQQLVSQLGVSDSQAEGGAGLLMGLLQDKLSAGDFQQIAAAVPGVSDLIAKAPSEGGSGLGGLLGGVASAFGADDLGDLAKLAGGFSDLGLDADMVGKFAPIIIDFLQQQGGDGIGDLVAKVLQGN